MNRKTVTFLLDEVEEPVNSPHEYHVRYLDENDNWVYNLRTCQSELEVAKAVMRNNEVGRNSKIIAYPHGTSHGQHVYYNGMFQYPTDCTRDSINRLKAAFSQLASSPEQEP